MDTMYRDEILELYREPLNFGKLSDFDATSKQLNPFCGDDAEIFVKFEKTQGGAMIPPLRWKVGEIMFRGNGCVICMASTSLLTEFAKGKTKLSLTKFSQDDMLQLLGIEISETRKKCALLGLAVLKDCLGRE